MGPQIVITYPGTDPGFRDENPATSHLSYGTTINRIRRFHLVFFNDRLQLLIQNIPPPCRHLAMPVTKIRGNSDTLRVYNIYTSRLIDNRQVKKVNTCGIEVGTILTSFRNTVNTKTPIAGARKAQQFPRISMYLMMAE
jgi:hypothetical protein